MSAVRRLAAGEAPALAAIVRGLPEYFTDDVPGKVEHDAADHEAWVITDDGTITGFVYVDTIDPLPGWPPGNPAAIYAAAIRLTRGEP
jgi:hypothetical protein